MATVLRIHLAGLLLLSYAALFNGVSVQKLTVNSSKVTLETKSSTVPELSLLNGANGVGVMYSRGAESARRHRNTLKLHNILRWDVDPPAANMPKLGWSSNLARLAQLWSRHCIMGYGLPLTLDPLTYSGQILQNIWSGGRDGTIEDALSSWLNEGNGYNFKTRACYLANGCKNYLTMVSATVHEVGCGLSHCNDDVIVVCYYGARDYKPHRSPYAAGKPCSQCDAFEWCDNGLCRSSSDKRIDGTVGSNCVNKNKDLETNDANSAVGSLEDGSHLGRQRRHTTEAAQETCNSLYYPLWIFVGILIGIVVFGLLIGIFYMFAHICKDSCTCYTDSSTSDGSCLGCCSKQESPRCCSGSGSSDTSESGGSSLFCAGVCRIMCCKKGSVTPTGPEGNSATESIPPEDPDSPDANVPDSVHAATQVDVEHREICTNTDPEPSTIDRSTCIEHDLLGTNTDPEPSTIDRSTCIEHDLLGTNDVDTNTDPEPTTIDRSTSIEHDLLCTNDVGTSAVLECIDAEVQVPEEPVEQIDQTDSSQGVCLVHGCQTCDLHRRDMRQVDKLRTKNTRKLIKASKNKNLAPGTFII